MIEEPRKHFLLDEPFDIDKFAETLDTKNLHHRDMALALVVFIKTINVTGGMVRSHKEHVAVPAIDEDWIDLGEAYLAACDAIGAPVQWANAAEEEEEDRPVDIQAELDSALKTVSDAGMGKQPSPLSK